MKKIIILTLLSLLLLPSLVLAQLSIFRPAQGGTGIGSAVAGDVGKCLTVSTNSPFTYVFATCGGSSFAFPYKTLGTGENATSTTIAFLNGFISTASSTASSLVLSNLSTGRIPYSDGNRQLVSASTLAFDDTTGKITTTISNSTYASTTELSVSQSGTNAVAAISVGAAGVGLNNCSNNVCLVTGNATAQWSGSALFPGSDNAKNIGLINNRWLNLWLSGTATTTNLYADGSTTLQNFTASNATTSNATTTNLYVSGTGNFVTSTSTTLKANSATIGNLTVSSCSGCSSAGSTWYFATSTSNRDMVKTVSLVAGDWLIIDASILHTSTSFSPGDITYRMTSPWVTASTTLAATSGYNAKNLSVHYLFEATTTSTVTVDFAAGDAITGIKSMSLQIINVGYGNNF